MRSKLQRHPASATCHGYVEYVSGASDRAAAQQEVLGSLSGGPKLTPEQSAALDSLSFSEEDVVQALAWGQRRDLTAYL